MQRVAARRFGLVHRDIRLLQYFVGVVLRVPEHRDADARTTPAFAAIEYVRLVKSCEYLLGDGSLPQPPASSGSSLRSCSNTTNSSPPNRATVSASRMLATIRRATSCSSRSPM